MAKKKVEKLSLEQKLWKTADKLRGNMDAAEYKHVVLGLIFLKYISDSFMDKHDELEHEVADSSSDLYVSEPKARYGIINDPDEYRAENIFWVPPEARWDYLESRAKQPNIGNLVDDAMDAIERDNAALKGVLPKDYGRPGLDKRVLGELIDLIGTIGLGDKESKSKDILGRVYEYFLGMFADAEGKRGGQFYTPKCIVELLVEMLEPYKGRVFDPCCGSGGMFVQSEKFVEKHGGRIGDISVYGQESNQTTYKLCRMNLAIRGIESHIKWNNDGSFIKDAHLDLKADYIIANPPFNQSDWGIKLLQDDKRWTLGTPPDGNANYGWIQHFIHHLAPNGIAGFVLANGSMSSNTGGEGDIRQKMIEQDLVDCMVALPSQLFYNTMIPACLWFVTRNKRDRKGKTLFIDAREMGEMISRRNRELTDDEVSKIALTYHNWKQGKDYEDEKGFCKSANLVDIKKHDYILTPGRYVGIKEEEDDGIPFEEKMKSLTSELSEQFKESARLEKEIKLNLKNIGFEVI